MFKRILNWLLGKPKSVEEKVETPLVPIELPRQLTTLPIAIQKALEESEDSAMVIFNKSKNIAYRANRALLEHIHELSERDEQTPFAVEAKLLCMHFTIDKFGFLNSERKVVVGFFDNSVPTSVQHSAEIIFSEKIPTEDWWKEFNVTQKDIRHVRLSHQPVEGRVYTNPLSEWFRQQPTQVEKEDKSFIIIDKKKDEYSQWLNYNGFQIQVTEVYIRVFISKRDKRTLKKVVKEVKGLRRHMLSRHILISMTDNPKDIPKELEVLKHI